MALISDEYREQNRLLHVKDEHYGSKGYKNAKAVIRLMIEYDSHDVLDYGCGKRGLELGLKETRAVVRNYDPATEFSADPAPADIVVCADVLEHIEPEYLDNVLAHLVSKVKKCGYFVVSCRSARNHLPDGRNTHLIVQKPLWWLDKIREYFHVAWSHVHPSFEEVVFLVEPKHESNHVPD